MIKHRLQIVGSVVVLAVVGAAGTDYLLGKLQPVPSSSFLTNTAAAIQSEPIKQNMFSSTLGDDLDSVIAKWSNLEIAVSVVDLGTGTQYNAGESDVTFRGASTTKLITAVTFLHEVDLGNASLGEYIDGTSARQLLKQMIEVSDNDAWASLLDYLGNKEQAYAEEIGLTTYIQMPDHIITSSDEAKLLALIYNDNILSSESKELLLAHMKAANYSELIAAAVPAEATVYHKYGSLYGNLHDTAIVTYKGHNFALVIFTKNPDNTIDDYDERLELIHQITQATLNNLII